MAEEHPYLDEWSVWQLVSGDLVVAGQVSGHGRYPPGQWMVTSPLQSCQPGQRLVATRNSHYYLGEPTSSTPAELHHLTQLHAPLRGAHLVRSAASGCPLKDIQQICRMQSIKARKHERVLDLSDILNTTSV